MRRPLFFILWLASSALAVEAAVQCALGQITLPEITVTPPKEAPKSKVQKQKAPATAKAPAPIAAPPPASPPPESPFVTETKAFNAARENILPKIGVNTYELSHQDIEALPQGTNAQLDKVLLQAPGVTLDSAAGGNLHVRNEHANLQYRINGIIIPDGVSGFGQLLETSFVGSMSLVTGALPAQYGFRNTGLVDIQTRSGAQDPGATISIYGGNRSTFTPSIEYGGTSGQTEYFFTGRGFFTDLGLENPTPAINAIHDWTQQGRAFGYLSTLLDGSTRLTTISGISIQKYQIPNNPGQPPSSRPSASPISTQRPSISVSSSETSTTSSLSRRSSTVQMYRLPISHATARCILRPIHWATSSSTGSPRTSIAAAFSTASRVTPRFGWTRHILSVRDSTQAQRAPRSPPRIRYCRLIPIPARPSTHHSMSSMPTRRWVTCWGFTSRTSGSSPIS